MPEILCEHLQPLLEAELSTGNAVAASGPAPGRDPGALVLLTRPFRAVPPSLPTGVVHVEVNDPHWWKEELRCTVHHDVLACPSP